MLTLSLFLLLIFSSIHYRRDQKVINFNFNFREVTIIGITIIIYTIIILILSFPWKTLYLFNNMLVINRYLGFSIILSLICMATLTVLLLYNFPGTCINNDINNDINNYLNPDNPDNKEGNINLFNVLNSERNIWTSNIFFICIELFNAISLIGLLMSNNLTLLYIFIELQSYSLYIITAIKSRSSLSAHNSLLYFLFGSFASILILLGIALIYFYTGNTYLDKIELLSHFEVFNSLYIGLFFILLGFLVKIGAAPFFHWAIQIYSNSHLLTTAYISLIPKLSILTYIYYLNSIFTFTDYYLTSNLLLMITIITLILPTLLGLKQSKIKGLLGYSSIMNIGYLIAPLLSQGDLGVSYFLIYLYSYALNHILIFILVTFFNQATFLNQLKYVKENSFWTLSLIIIISSFIGLPPLLSFYGKFFIFVTSIMNNNWFILLTMIISSIIFTFIYLRILYYGMNYGMKITTKSKEYLSQIEKSFKLNNLLTYLLSCLVILIIFNFVQYLNTLKGAYISSFEL